MYSVIQGQNKVLERLTKNDRVDIEPNHDLEKRFLVTHPSEQLRVHLAFEASSEENRFVSFSVTTSDASRTSIGLYSTQLENGESSEVFQATALLTTSEHSEPQPRTGATSKVAIKRLKQSISPAYFLREYEALQTTSRLRYGNVVETISVFRHETDGVQYFNFAFPLALGNLKRLFRGDCNGQPFASSSPLLWTQFEALANALVFLHEKA
ncbi:hypothetical protein CC80DRAFT_549805 [Byssothecium circinans]|uniref:Protein kinase domain-containing protein n=1 Tax=Byssothecium circinans TaxID=147558 RepID=A0A6A5TTL7_9PLEO|nr:hypothetical protein CC80DRAFT_549805 [Byssothecium circinans]